VRSAGMIDATFHAAARALTSPEMGTEAVAPLLYDLVMLHLPPAHPNS
jgi:hypothetical protein